MLGLTPQIRGGHAASSGQHKQPCEHGHSDLDSTQATVRNLGDIRAQLRGVMTMDLVGSSHTMRLTEHSSHRFRVSP